MNDSHDTAGSDVVVGCGADGGSPGVAASGGGRRASLYLLRRPVRVGAQLEDYGESRQIRSIPAQVSTIYHTTNTHNTTLSKAKVLLTL